MRDKTVLFGGRIGILYGQLDIQTPIKEKKEKIRGAYVPNKSTVKTRGSQKMLLIERRLMFSRLHGIPHRAGQRCRCHRTPPGRALVAPARVPGSNPTPPRHHRDRAARCRAAAPAPPAAVVSPSPGEERGRSTAPPGG